MIVKYARVVKSIRLVSSTVDQIRSDKPVLVSSFFVSASDIKSNGITTSDV